MTDLSTMIAAKSDQLNADDLLGGPRDIEVTKVRGCTEPDQPVAIHYVGDEGKPWKPCKTMRRVLVYAWGKQGDAYVGRRLRLYRDDGVKFGGIQVGGIRISHMSHLDADLSVAVMITRGKKAPYKVEALRDQRSAATSTRQVPQGDEFPGDRSKTSPPATTTLTLTERCDAFLKRVRAATASVKLDGIWAASEGLRAELDERSPDLLEEITAGFNARKADLDGGTEEEPA